MLGCSGPKYLTKSNVNSRGLFVTYITRNKAGCCQLQGLQQLSRVGALVGLLVVSLTFLLRVIRWLSEQQWKCPQITMLKAGARKKLVLLATLLMEKRDLSQEALANVYIGQVTGSRLNCKGSWESFWQLWRLWRGRL